jgi:hypothetical protein
MTCPADLPDWLLDLFQGDRKDEPCDGSIKASSFMDVRRMWPGIRFDASQPLTAGYGADAARHEDPSGRITAFWLSRGFERPERSGRFGRGE